MRIVFMGTPEFAIPSLRILVEFGYTIAAVITAPDRPAGRGLQLKPSPVKEYARSQGLLVLQPEKLRDPEFLEALRATEPDLAVVVAFRMLPEVVWRMPKRGTFNLHASLLPDYRGAAPINWAIINGETETGATTFFLEKEIDTGNILLQRRVPIPPEWNAGELHDVLSAVGSELVLETVRAIEADCYTPHPQDPTAFVHPAPKIFKEDCRIDWSRPAVEVHNLIRGLSPFPTAWTMLNGKILKVYQSALQEGPSLGSPGTATIDQGRIRVQCADGQVDILTLQLEGKGRMETIDFLRGYKDAIARMG